MNKCYPYWPDENTDSSHAGILIKCKSKEVFADFTISSLTISKVRYSCHILLNVIFKKCQPQQATFYILISITINKYLKPSVVILFWILELNFLTLSKTQIDYRNLENNVIYLLLFFKDGEERNMTHCQYTTWPDRGVPQYVTPLIEYLQMIRSMQNDDSPMLVHCRSATVLVYV